LYVESEELARRAAKAASMADASCRLCAHKCSVPRAQGVCGVDVSRVASEKIHVGEETVISPSHALFLSGCNARCSFCQAHRFSQNPSFGPAVSPSAVARRIEQRKREGARNVNLVGGEPTPHLPFILEARSMVRCDVKVVWNSNMYISDDALDLLDGVVDIYLADLKFGNDRCAVQLAGLNNYLSTLQRSFSRATEARLLVRHLVLPGHLECCTRPALEWLREVAPSSELSLLLNYFPDYRADGSLTRELSIDEARTAISWARELGFTLVA
jgi:putative pyruvate formate lyase activating enzyme